VKLNGPGPVTRLDDNLIKVITDAIPRVIIQQHVAYLTDIPPQTLHHWLKRGNTEIKEGISPDDSIYVKLSQAYYHKRSEVLEEKLARLDECPKNYGAITWLLEKCFKDDFESKSDHVKQLEDYVLNFIKPMMAKGGFESGRKETEEVHTESN
jgi:hypothetical protein